MERRGGERPRGRAGIISRSTTTTTGARRRRRRRLTLTRAKLWTTPARSFGAPRADDDAVDRLRRGRDVDEAHTRRDSLRAAQRCSPFTRDPPSRRLRPARFMRAPAAPMEVRLPDDVCPRSATDDLRRRRQRPSLATTTDRVLRARRRRILRLTVSPRPSIFAVPTLAVTAAPRAARARAPARPPLTCRSRRPRRTRARARPSPPLRARARARSPHTHTLPSRPPRTLRRGRRRGAALRVRRSSAKIVPALSSRRGRQLHASS